MGTPLASTQDFKGRIPAYPAGTAVCELEIECLPRNIPEAVEIDVSRLGIGESLRVHDITVPNATILNDGDLPVASVLEPRTPQAGDEATPADAEPEVVRGRGGDEG